jgi:hypothetical protein
VPPGGIRFTTRDDAPYTGRERELVKAVAASAGPRAEVDTQRRIAAAHFEPTPNWQSVQRAIDQQMRAAVQPQIFKVDSRLQ